MKILLLVLVLSTQTMAHDVYGGVSHQLGEYESDQKVNLSVLSAVVGVNINKYLSLEGQIGKGLYSVDVGGATYSINGVGSAYIKARIPINDLFTMRAYGGFSVANVGCSPIGYNVIRNYGGVDAGASYGLSISASITKDLYVEAGRTIHFKGSNFSYSSTSISLVKLF